MISQLTIQNFGLIDSLTLEFGDNLNVFTGETGAGKSILIDALHYALGARLNTSQLRDDQKPCVVEAVFNLTSKQLKESPLLSEYISEDEPSLIVNRRYSPDGRNKNKVNGFAITLSELKEMGNHLVDFHGPHDHQLLFTEKSHMDILDRLSDLKELKNEYSQKYHTYSLLRKELYQLEELSKNSERELDTLKHQLKELEQVPLEAAKYEELLAESTRVDNAEKLYGSAAELVAILENDQYGMNQLISKAFSPLSTLNSTDGTTAEYTNILERIQDDTSDLLSLLTGYLDSLSFQPEEANKINRLRDVYHDITRKYGPTLEDAGKFYIEAQRKYDLLINMEHNDKDLKNKIKTSQKNLQETARKITAKRKASAGSLKKTIEHELKELGIEHVRFECRIETTDLNRDGQDNVVFYISPNAGESLKPLAEIVSSGEAARVMLALKKALTKVDPIGVLIFDEIDAQIGGRLGSITGKKLKELSRNRQVILITHLPQIASFGDNHFKVLKEVIKGRTTTNVNPLTRSDRVKELAKMMSGKAESKIAVKHAEDMLVKAGVK